MLIKLLNWWDPRPMTEDDMKAEIAMSRIKGEPHQEFTDKAVHDTLEALNLIGKYDGERNSEA